VKDNCTEIDLPRDVIIGVVGDTHIPDRVNSLHPDLMPGLRQYNVDLVFHTGDICKMQVLEELRQLAPVYAVRGNRDFFLPEAIQMTRRFRINGVQILLTHGHVNSWHYWMDKVEYMLSGYRPERYVRRLRGIEPSAKLVIFGHSHRAENLTYGTTLFINPGSSCSGDLTSAALSYGVIKISPAGEIESEIIALEGFRIRSGSWVKIDTA
jgi:putative phosphoesterase